MKLNHSGQITLLGMAIGLLLLVTSAIVFLINQISTNRHGDTSAQSSKGLSVAEDGISYAIRDLSVDRTVWKNALNGDFAPTACNTENFVSSSSNTRFKIYCSTGTLGNPNLQTFQVAVTAVAYSSELAGQIAKPLRARKAYISQRTLGVDLTSGLNAAAAVELVRVPQISGTLNVHWGPIVCLNIDNNPLPFWTLSGPLDSQRYPRKFSVGGISGIQYGRSGGLSGEDSDQKEFWANATMDPPPSIAEAAYAQRAYDAVGITPPTLQGGAPLPASNCTVNPPATCGYFNTQGGTAIFSGTYTGNPVIFVNGSAVFQDVFVDRATFIITGALTITGNASGNVLNLHVPWTAPLEYPYAPSAQPCSGFQGGSCMSGGPFTSNGGAVNYRGFLYVKGNLFVNVPSWNMVGALYVGNTTDVLGTSGRLNIPGQGGPPGATLTVAYDDEIGQNILANPMAGGPVKLGIDLVQAVTPF